MRVLAVLCHPDPESYTASLWRDALAALAAAGHETRRIDLYAEGFDPVLSREGWRAYLDTGRNAEGIEAHVAALRWAEALVLVYPTWWYGLPAMLKGWFDRVWLPGVAFELPPEGDIRPALRNIRVLATVTPCGASWGLTQLVGAPGRSLVRRGLRMLLAPRCRTLWLAHYRMDTSTPESRARFRERVVRAMRRL
jgi:putative NADPH-quinone reductase